MRASSPCLSLSILALLLCARLAGGESPAAPSLDELYDTPRPGKWPQQIAWSPDGARLGYLLPGDNDGQELWALEVASGEHARLLTGRELAAEGEEPLEVDGYRFSPDGARLLVEAGGDLHLLDLAPGERHVHRLAGGDAPREGPAFSPDGRLLAFVRGADLHLFDLTTGDERALTSDGRPGEILNGKTDWVYGEEIYDRQPRGFWWSPDGTRIAFYRFDEREVEGYPLVDFQPRYPEVTWQKYPKAGGANPRVRIGVVAAAGGEATWLDVGGDDDYLARVDWLPGGERLAVQRLNREQNRLELTLCSPADGRCAPLAVDEHPTWVNLSNDLTFLADGRFVWSSERSGWRRLYLYGAGGELLRTLSAEGLAVTSLDGVDEAAGHLTYTAFATTPLGAARRALYRVGLDGANGRRLTDEGGWHEALMAPAGGAWLHTESTGDRPPSRRVVRADGAALPPLPTGPKPVYDPAALPAWEMLTLAGPGGVRLPARLLRPPGFDPERRYPVILFHYGCPNSQVVSDRWDARGRDLWHKVMAGRGYLVLAVDNVTSIFFGKAGEDRAHRDFGPFDLEALLAAVEYLEALPGADTERLGLWGWSGGGTTTLGALLAAPGVFRAAVAGAPVTDWRLYDSIWTERYLDHPDDNPQGYAASSPVTRAADLADPLLLVHGLADDNVHPQNSFVMSQALIEAGRPFEQLILPRQKHGLKDKGERHFYLRMAEFFDRSLGRPQD